MVTGMAKEHRDTAEQIMRAAQSLVEAHGGTFIRGRLPRIINRNLRRGDIAEATRQARAYVVRHNPSIPELEEKPYLRALSLECRDNPYMTEWLRKVHGGLPG